MADNAVYTLLDRQNIATESGVAQYGDAVDMLGHSVLRVSVQIHAAGTAGTIKLQHSAFTDPNSFLDITSASWNLNSAGVNYLAVTDFLRYVRWVTDTSVAGSPVVTLQVVAKGH